MKKNRGHNGNSEDSALWQKVADTVKAYGSAPRAGAPEKKPRPAAPRASGAARAAPPPVSSVPPRGFDAATERRLKRGQMEIEARIDLHGLGRVEAFAALSRFLSSAKRRGLRNVLVVTGKGTTPGSGVLRRLLPEWLAEPALAALVLACTPARPKDGGAGAFYLRLRKPKTDRD